MDDTTGLERGAYEALVTRALANSLAGTDDAPTVERLDSAEAAGRLASHLRAALEQHLASVPSKDRPRAQAELTNRLIAWLNEGTSKPDTTGMAIADPASPEILRLLTAPRLPGQEPPKLPVVPLVDHDLLANAPGEPAFAHALASELETADRVDAVIAFIRWTGLNLLRPTIERLRRNDVPIRILTTTFTGSTERKALDWLVEHGAQVKVSYDTRTTRLHAKAWLVHRNTGYSTAYVGSSNLSHSALVDGIEWNVRLAEASAPAVLDKLRATFD